MLAPLELNRIALPPFVTQRAPSINDAHRWRSLRLSGHDYLFAQPITFTPYAAARPCSARCRFCSENLRQRNPGMAASMLRPGKDYFLQLDRVLAQLRSLPIGYSLSGLETTDDRAWMLALLDVLQSHTASGQVTDKVLYTNGAGLAVDADSILSRLLAFDLDWLEVSRHHFDANINQRIMRFRESVAVTDQARFENTLRQCNDCLPVKLVCIVQQGGIASAVEAAEYIAWAQRLGIRHVIFREFSVLDDSYVPNATARYIATHRVPMDKLLIDCMASSLWKSWRAEGGTDGYYFWNVFGKLGATQVTFESSDYAVMQRQHAAFREQQRVYKLVFHPNGNLCAGWQPERDVILPIDL
jgi:hypothetical protein